MMSGCLATANRTPTGRAAAGCFQASAWRFVRVIFFISRSADARRSHCSCRHRKKRMAIALREAVAMWVTLEVSHFLIWACRRSTSSDVASRICTSLSIIAWTGSLSSQAVALDSEPASQARVLICNPHPTSNCSGGVLRNTCTLKTNPLERIFC